VVAAPTPSRPGERSYLLRVVNGGSAGGRRYVVQDLRSGERRSFDDEQQLRCFLNGERPARLR